MQVQIVKQERAAPNKPWVYKPILGVDVSNGTSTAYIVPITGPDGKISATFLPNTLPSMAGNVGKFLTVSGVNTTAWTPIYHNLTEGKQGGDPIQDEFYHLTEQEHTEATQYASETQPGLLRPEDFATFKEHSVDTTFYLKATTHQGQMLMLPIKPTP